MRCFQCGKSISEESRFCLTCGAELTINHSHDDAAKHDKFDVFISYCRADSTSFVRDLVAALRSAGLRVWYDELHVSLGMQLPDALSEGIARSRYGIIVASEGYFTRTWTLRELDLWLTRQDNILPIWHGIDQSFLQQNAPALASILGVDSKQELSYIVSEIRTAANLTVRSTVLLCDGDTDVFVANELGVVLVTSNRLKTKHTEKIEFNSRISEERNRGRITRIFEFSGREITDQSFLGLFDLGKETSGDMLKFQGRLVIILTNKRLASDVDIKTGIIVQFADEYGIADWCLPVIAHRHFTLSIVNNEIRQAIRQLAEQDSEREP
jgi:hypothetical protein